MRSILKRASSVSHPETEHQKKVALEKEQEPNAHQSTHTSDATRATGGEPAQEVTRASNGNKTGSDVVMEGDSVGESSSEHPDPSGSDGRRRITTKRTTSSPGRATDCHCAARPEQDSGENDANDKQQAENYCEVRTSGRHHARGTRRVSGKDDENRDCREQLFELGISSI